MALNGLNSGLIQAAVNPASKRQTLDFWMSFVTILVLCVKLDLALPRSIQQS